MSNASKPDTRLYDPAIVDAIVRQVMERLAGSQTKPIHKNDPQISSSRDVAENVTSLELNDKVVTLEVLRGKLDGARRLRVRPGAIVTPAVKDELRSRAIELETSGSKEPGPTGSVGQFCLARLSSHFVPLEWLKQIGLKDVCHADDYEQIADKLASGYSNGKSICLAAQPYVAVSTLNRNHDLRAAMGRNMKDIAEIKATLNANVLVLDSVQSHEQLLGMIKSFVSDQRGAQS